MADITVTEYAEVATDEKGNLVQAGLEPSQAVQTVASGSASDPFQPSTTLVMITSTANQRLKFSQDGSAATSQSTLILTGERFFGVRKGARVYNLDAV